MKKSLKIYLVYSLSLLSIFAFEVWLFPRVHPFGALLVVYPAAAISGVMAIGYIFGMPGVWLFHATVGRLVERIERE